MGSFLHFFVGAQTLCFEASCAGEVIELCRRYGFVYRNLRFCRDRLYLDLTKSTAKRLRSACDACGISAEPMGERGLPSLLRRYRHRVGILVGALCASLIILLVLSLKQSAGSGNFSAFYLPITLSLLLRFLALIRWKGSVDLSLSLTIWLRPMICCL